MIYQQEIREINSYYEKYKDKEIVFSKEVSQNIGLIQKSTVIKVGDTAVSGALISSTMESFVLLAKLDTLLKQTIYDLKGSLSVHLTFISRETGKTLLFSIHTKFLNMNNQGLAQQDRYFLAMQIRRKIPNDLIRIFGSYHEEAAKRSSSRKKKVECLLLSNDIKIDDCFTERISKTELTLLTANRESINLNQKAIAILKILNTGEVLEIIGSVTGITGEADGKSRISIQYSMDDQSPRFGYSIHVLRNLINS